MTVRGLGIHEFERCPACGQRVQDFEVRNCSLCGFDYGDRRTTNADLTPYSIAYERGESALWRMVRWIWFARTERLKHLGLMRDSAAARRFAWWNLFFVALALAVFQFTAVGWLVVDATSVGVVTKPRGAGWIALGNNPPSGLAQPGPQLWWNAAQSLIAGALAFVAAILLAWLSRALISAGIRLAHAPDYRSEGRMSAALLYSTGFFLPALLAAMVMAIRPFAYLAASRRSAWSPSEAGLLFLAGICIGLPLVFWWLWMIRLGSTAPANCRSRVVSFMFVGLPAILALNVLAWNVGLDRLLQMIFAAMRLDF